MAAMDQISRQRILTLAPELRDETALILDEIDAALTSPYVQARVSHALRTFDEQTAIWKKGRDARGRVVGKIFTKAKAGQSYHNYGLAVDMAILVDRDKNGTFESVDWTNKSDYDFDNVRDFMEIVAIFKKYGWVWGGDFNNNGIQGDDGFIDYPHFQKTFGKSIKWLQSAKYRAGTHYPIFS